MAFLSLKTLSIFLYALGFVGAIVIPDSSKLEPYNSTLSKRQKTTFNSQSWTPGTVYWYARNEPFLNFQGGYNNEEISFWFQLDGNFVVYSTGGVPQWYSNTGGHSCTDGGDECVLVYGGDGNLVIVIDNEAVWSTATNANSGNDNTASQLLVFSNGYAGQDYGQTFDTNDSPFVLILGPYFSLPEVGVMYASAPTYHDGDHGQDGIPNGGAPISGVPVTYGGNPDCNFRRDLEGRC